jgi:hypothetical protein
MSYARPDLLAAIKSAIAAGKIKSANAFDALAGLSENYTSGWRRDATRMVSRDTQRRVEDALRVLGVGWDGFSGAGVDYMREGSLKGRRFDDPGLVVKL